MTSVAVIGAGHNGLVCADFLARAGLDVTVFEANATAGGCIWTEALETGHRLERGAIEHGLIVDIANELELHRHGLEYVRRDTLVGAGYADGTSIVFESDLEATIQTLADLAPEDAAGYTRLAAIGQALLGALAEFPAAPGLAEIATLGLVGDVDPVQLLLASSRKVVEAHVSNPHLAGALTMYGAHSQIPPWIPGSGVFALILAASHGHPPSRPVGGSSALIDALVADIEDAGGSVKLGAAVDRLSPTAEGVTVAAGNGCGGVFDRVVSTLGAPMTAQLAAPSSVGLAGRIPAAAGALNVAELKVDLALSTPATAGGFGSPEAIWMLQPEPGSLDKSFGEIVAGRLPGRPSMMWAAPSTLDATAAPAGGGTAWISSFVPAQLDEGEWNDATEARAADWLLDGLDAITGGDVRSSVVDMRVSGPGTWEHRNGARFGNPNHIDMTIDQLFSFRPPTSRGYRTAAPWLYLSGAGTYPGGGLTGLPGRNAAMVLLGDLGERRKKRSLTSEVASLARGWQLYRNLKRRT